MHGAHATGIALCGRHLTLTEDGTAQLHGVSKVPTSFLKKKSLSERNP